MVEEFEHIDQKDIPQRKNTAAGNSVEAERKSVSELKALFEEQPTKISSATEHVKREAFKEPKPK